MDRETQQKPKSRFSVGANGQSRFGNRKPTRNLFTGAEMDPKSETSRPQSPGQPQPGRIPRSIRPVRSVSGLSTSSAGSAGLGDPGERSAIPRLSRTPSRTDMHERPPSVASSTGSSRSESRLPRPSLAHSQMPKTKPRRPMDLFDAWKMTEEVEELGRASPSPAPRLAIPHRTQDESRLQRLKSQSPLDFTKRTNGLRKPSDPILDENSTTSSVGRSSIPRPVRPMDEKEDEFDRKIRQFGQDHERKNGQVGRESALFSRSKIGERVAEAGKELVKKTSSSSLKENSPSRPRTWGSKGRVHNAWMKRVLASPEKEPLQERTHNPSTKGKEVASHDIPLPSVEVQTSAPAALDAPVPPPIKKDFTWELDADFTEGDLQISDSPRVTFPRNAPPTALPATKGSPRHHRTSATPSDLPSKIEETEPETEANFLANSAREPNDSPRRTNKRLEEIRNLEQDSDIKTGFPTRPRSRSNTKLDEVREREVESSSRRAIASIKLDEIRERNSLSPSLSPRIPPKPKPYPVQEPTPDPSEGRPSEAPREESKPTPAEPVSEKGPKPSPTTATGTEGGIPSPKRYKKEIHRRDSSRELLRRLSRMSSNSPQETGANKKSDKTARLSGSIAASDAKPLSPVPASVVDRLSNSRPSVGFVGLSRSASLDSLPSKRSSRSDIDPTDRIEAEKDLFAPQDNYSERESVPAQSLRSSDEDEFETVEETPRAPRPDPLTQPTPKVIGAYVDTPATVKVEKIPDQKLPEIPIEPPAEARPAGTVKQEETPVPEQSNSTAQATEAPVVKTHVRHKSAISATSGREDTASSKRTTRRTRTSSGLNPSRRRRARSVPALTNSARVPTVREDLREIHRRANFEDSTLEDFEEFVRRQEQAAESETEEEPKVAKNGGEEEEGTDAMRRRLDMALGDIRSARAWANKFEAKLNEHDAQATTPTTTTTTQATSPPRQHLFNPRSLLGPLGWALALFASWFVLEVNFCWFFCRPYTCGPTRSCEWSPDDPTFGNALPVKLDQWVTGGWGVKVFSQVAERAGDYFVDSYCSLTNDPVGRSGCRYSMADRRRIQRIMKRRGEEYVKYEPISPSMLQWLESKKREEARRKQQEAEGAVANEEDDVGFISGDEVL